MVTALTPCQNYCVEPSVRERGRVPPGSAPHSLVLLFSSFLAAALPRQCFFYAFSFAGLQVERVTFHFLDDVLGLYLPLEPAQCVFEGFSLLKSYFSQLDYTPQLALTGPFSYGKLA